MNKKYNKNGTLIRAYNYDNVDESKLRNPKADEIKLISRAYEYLVNRRIKTAKRVNSVLIMMLVLFILIIIVNIFDSEKIGECVIFIIFSLIDLRFIHEEVMYNRSNEDLLNNIRNGNFKLLDLICDSDVTTNKVSFETHVNILYPDGTLFRESVRTAGGGLEKGSSMYLVYTEYKIKSKTLISDDIITPYMLTEEGYKSVVVIDHKVHDAPL